MSSCLSPDCESIDEKLPSSKFDKEFTKKINLEALENAAIYKKLSEFDEKWLQNFYQIFLEYYNSILKESSIDIRNKICRDLNYYTDYVLYLIDEIINHYEQINKRNEFKRFRNNIRYQVKLMFPENENVKCYRDEKEHSFHAYIRKKLDDFCQNRDHLVSSVHSDIGKCDILLKYVKEQYDNFVKDDTCFSENNIQKEKIFHINDRCTLHDIPRTFSFSGCDNHEIQYRIKNIPLCPSEYISIFDNFAYFLSDYVGDIPNLSKIVEYTVYVSVVILGMSILFCILYKFSPLGYFLRNKKIKDEMKQNVNVDIMEMLENSSHYENIQAQNTPYHISYHKIQSS
ncbi:PIR Superfamily Protein [Plasmodium ovale curtisi]|uniref:PIR Superfamily Protein n=1 Tax=Plasmodium ovale curtisi TaxID=864141 RepID=A0A1A8XA27_PLAOA|nr:PIR Superfamily Protein [Plasmodium ovale curtisi]SBT01126.1 PIR Superfamily Protein [Plasmodium ovale curtisi]